MKKEKVDMRKGFATVEMIFLGVGLSALAAILTLVFMSVEESCPIDTRQAVVAKTACPRNTQHQVSTKDAATENDPFNLSGPLSPLRSPVVPDNPVKQFYDGSGIYNPYGY